MAQNMCQWVAHTEIFAECRSKMEWMYFRKQCQYDMCARENNADNTPMCIWVAAMARACKEIDVIVDWQANTELLLLCGGIILYEQFA